MQNSIPSENPDGKIRVGEDTLFAVVREGEEDNQEIFFGKGHQAILWAMITNPYLLPIPFNESKLDEDHVQGMIDSLPSNLDQPLQNLIYSGNQTYHLYQYYPKEDIPFFTKKSLSDAELLVSTIPNLATFRVIETLTPLFDAAFVFINQENELDFNLTMTAMLKIIELIAQGRSFPVSRAAFGTFKLANPKLLKPVTKYRLDWEKIWYRFALVREEFTKLKIQNTFKYFSDSRFVAQIPVTLTFEALNGGELISNEAIGNTFCLRNIYGFSWENNSCFMDSTLISMFAFNGTPFFENLIEKPLPEIFQEPICCNDRRVDKALRIRIKAALSLEVKQLMEGKIIVCSELRKVLGRLCRRTDYDEDFSTAGPGGMGYDPNDLYARLMRALQYNPLIYRQISTSAMNANGAQARETQSFITHAPFLDPLIVYEHDRISYPESWNRGYEATGSRESPFISRELKILKADVIVFQLGRGYNAEMENEMQKTEQSNLDSVLSSLSIAPSENKEDASKNLSALLDALNSIPSGPNLPHNPQNRVYTNRRIEVDRIFDVNGIPYYLRAVVFLPTPGHYAALINCGTSWFEYDDVKLNHKRNLISQNYVSDSVADEIISTKAVMFFYYPDPNSIEMRNQIEMRVMANDEQLYGKYQEPVPILSQEEIDNIRRPMSEEEIYQARCQWEMPLRPIQPPLFNPLTNDDEELQKALAMSMMPNSPKNEDEELQKALAMSMMPEEEEQQETVMPTLKSPWKQDFLQRWFASKVLVIGASYTNEDFQRWVFVDMNYIGVETVNPKNQDQVVQFAGDNGANLFAGVWNEDPVWDTLLNLAQMTGKKFNSIWIDLNAWNKLSSYSGMGKKIIDTVGLLLVDSSRDEQNQYIGTFNVPDEQMEHLVSENNTTEVVPLWVHLIRIGKFKQIADETYSEMTDKNEETHLYRLLVPNVIYLK